MGSYGCNKEYNKVIEVDDDAGEWYRELAKFMMIKKDEKSYGVAVDGLLLYIADLLKWSNEQNRKAIIARLDVGLKTVNHRVKEFEKEVYLVYYSNNVYFDSIFAYEEEAIKYCEKKNKVVGKEYFFYKKEVIK